MMMMMMMMMKVMMTKMMMTMTMEVMMVINLHYWMMMWAPLDFQSHKSH